MYNFYQTILFEIMCYLISTVSFFVILICTHVCTSALFTTKSKYFFYKIKQCYTYHVFICILVWPLFIVLFREEPAQSWLIILIQEMWSKGPSVCSVATSFIWNPFKLIDGLLKMTKMTKRFILLNMICNRLMLTCTTRHWHSHTCLKCIPSCYYTWTRQAIPRARSRLDRWQVAFCNIYIFIAIAFDKTSSLVAVYFSTQNIYQSCDLVRAVRRSDVDVSQRRCLLTDVCVTLVTYRHDVKRGSAASWLFQALR